MSKEIVNTSEHTQWDFESVLTKPGILFYLSKIAVCWVSFIYDSGVGEREMNWKWTGNESGNESGNELVWTTSWKYIKLIYQCDLFLQLLLQS